MKRIRILSFGLIVTLLFLSRLSAFGHSPCQSERDARDSAKKAYDAAQDWVDYYESQKTLIMIKKAKLQAKNPTDELGLAALDQDYIDAHISSTAAAKEAARLQVSLTQAQNALNVCFAHAYRTCGCAVHHTESLTSCGCSYNTWNNWCHCPASGS